MPYLRNSERKTEVILCAVYMRGPLSRWWEAGMVTKEKVANS